MNSNRSKRRRIYVNLKPFVISTDVLDTSSITVSTNYPKNGQTESNLVQLFS